ncbi:FAD-binding oxidoreductase, partial [Kibdelosporangium philippinense]|uniref:FAD-binding oxidoreductase n=1 Tax=Kibdelosporangium philippinense TaxID=211113 RepID=UPI0035F069DC
MLDLVLPEDPRYALSRNQFIGTRHEVLPQAVARCATPDDVLEALTLAADRDWPFAIRGGGHSNAGYSSSTGLVIDLSPASSTTLSDSLVTVGAGVRTGQLASVLAPLGLLVPTGSCPSVGLIGTALGGGFGSHGRMHGLTCDHLVSAEVVLASGKVVTASATSEPDLFWALRGAGSGNFGVVTSATFSTVESAPRTHFRYSWDLSAALIDAWQDWAPFAPPTTSAELILLSPDYIDDPPEMLLIGAGDPTELLARLPSPNLAEVKHLSATEAALLHATPYSAAAHDPSSIPLVHTRPGMSTAKTAFFKEPLPSFDALLAHFVAGRVPGEMREVAFTPWRGAYSTGPDTAFPHRDPLFMVKHTVLVGPNGAMRRGHEALAWLEASWATLGGTGAYANFPDASLPDWETAYYGPNVPRLREIKSRYDPGHLFLFDQAIRSVVSGYPRSNTATDLERPGLRRLWFEVQSGV